MNKYWNTYTLSHTNASLLESYLTGYKIREWIYWVKKRGFFKSQVLVYGDDKCHCGIVSIFYEQ